MEKRTISEKDFEKKDLIVEKEIVTDTEDRRVGYNYTVYYMDDGEIESTVVSSEILYGDDAMTELSKYDYDIDSEVVRDFSHYEYYGYTRQVYDAAGWFFVDDEPKKNYACPRYSAEWFLGGE